MPTLSCIFTLAHDEIVHTPAMHACMHACPVGPKAMGVRVWTGMGLEAGVNEAAGETNVKNLVSPYSESHVLRGTCEYWTAWTTPLIRHMETWPTVRHNEMGHLIWLVSCHT